VSAALVAYSPIQSPLLAGPLGEGHEKCSPGLTVVAAVTVGVGPAR